MYRKATLWDKGYGGSSSRNHRWKEVVLVMEARTSSLYDGADDRSSTKSARDMSSILRCFKLLPVTQRTSHTKTPQRRKSSAYSVGAKRRPPKPAPQVSAGADAPRLRRCYRGMGNSGSKMGSKCASLTHTCIEGPRVRSVCL